MRSPLRHVAMLVLINRGGTFVIDDGTPKEMPLSRAQPMGLDRLEVGFSENSSGALEGLVAGLTIGAM